MLLTRHPKHYENGGPKVKTMDLLWEGSPGRGKAIELSFISSDIHIVEWDIFYSEYSCYILCSSEVRLKAEARLTMSLSTHEAMVLSLKVFNFIGHS